MNIKQIIKYFEDGNVCVCGLRGRGKDMLFANVAIRRNKPYLSNVDYGGMYMPLDLETLDCGKNTYVNFISGKVKKYVFPYPQGTDIYVSDAGIYFPSQFCNELNKKYMHMATFQAISRHVAGANFHTNAQQISRVYDKIREQSDTYIMCMKCKVIPIKKGIVIQKIRIYEKYQSAVDRIPPFSIKMPLLGGAATRNAYKMQKELYKCTHGEIRDHVLIYMNKSNYNTTFFKELLANGEIEEKKDI